MSLFDEYDKKLEETYKKVLTEKERETTEKLIRMETVLKKAVDMVNGKPLSSKDKDANLVLVILQTLDKEIRTEAWIEKCQKDFMTKFDIKSKIE